MDTIYLVFDQLPHKKDGGLVATYARFVREFSHAYDIKIVSIFSNGENDIEEFDECPIINFSNFNIDNRFFYAFKHLLCGHIKEFLHAIWSALRFFCLIPIARQKSKKIFHDSIVIASSPAAAIFIDKKTKYILEVHTKFEYFWGSNLLGRLQSALIPKPTLALFRTKSDAEKAHNILPSDYIYNGFDDSDIAVSKSATTPRKKCSALYVGGLAKHKNPLMLLRCAKKVKERFPSFTLDIYGTGELEGTLRKAISEMALENTVTLKGFINDKAIYSQYELFWFTSQLDGFGLVLIESMANATPVISTNWGDGVFEVVRDGETGYVVENEEEFVTKSIELLNDPSKRSTFGTRAKNDFNNRFTSQKNREQWERILDRAKR